MEGHTSKIDRVLQLNPGNQDEGQTPISYYMPFIDRDKEVEEIVHTIGCVAASYLDPAVDPILTPFATYLISTGIPGAGKTSLSRLGLVHACDNAEAFFPPHFTPQIANLLHNTVDQHMLFKLSYQIHRVKNIEIGCPEASVALRLLWEIIKPFADTARNSIWNSLDNLLRSALNCFDIQLHFRVSTVLDWYLTQLNSCRTLHFSIKTIGVIINLDEVHPIESIPFGGTAYLNGAVKSLQNTTRNRMFCVFPYITSTKTLPILKAFSSSAGEPHTIRLAPFSLQHSVQIVEDFYNRCSTGGRKLRIRNARFKTLEYILSLLSGNPRFIEMLIFVLGVDEKQEVWRAEQFESNLNDLMTLPPSSLLASSIFNKVSNYIIEKYRKHANVSLEALEEELLMLLGYSILQTSVSLNTRVKNADVSFDDLESNGFLALKRIERSPGQYHIDIPFIFFMHYYQKWFYGQVLKNRDTLVMPVLRHVDFLMNSDQFEELIVSTLVLRVLTLARKAPECMVRGCWIEVSLTDIFGFSIIYEESDHQVVLKVHADKCKNPKIVKSQHWITSNNWNAFVNKNLSDENIFGVVNAQRAPYWDGCVLTDPPMAVQAKQRLLERLKQSAGKDLHHLTVKDLQDEVDKCLPPGAYLVFVTDEIVPTTSGTRKRTIEGELESNAEDAVVSYLKSMGRVIVIDASLRKSFFGPTIANLISLSCSSCSFESQTLV